MARNERNPIPIQWWLPGGLFLLATVILFGEFIFSDEMLYGEDILALGYMGRDFFAERLSAGDFPLWTPRLLGGVPTIESISAADGVYPTSLLYFVMDSYRGRMEMVLHVLAGFFMYGWSRSLGLSRAAATVGGLAWLMAPVMVTLVLPGNDGKLMVAALAPLVFWATEVVLRNPSGRTIAGMAGAVAVVSLVTQFQTAYFLFGSAGAYAAFRAVQIWRATDSQGRPAARRALLPFGVFLGASLLGGGIAAFQVLPAGLRRRRPGTGPPGGTPEEKIAYSAPGPSTRRGRVGGRSGVRGQQQRGRRMGARHILGTERDQAEPRVPGGFGRGSGALRTAGTAEKGTKVVHGRHERYLASLRPRPIRRVALFYEMCRDEPLPLPRSALPVTSA